MSKSHPPGSARPCWRSLIRAAYWELSVCRNFSTGQVYRLGMTTQLSQKSNTPSFHEENSTTERRKRRHRQLRPLVMRIRPGGTFPPEPVLLLEAPQMSLLPSPAKYPIQIYIENSSQQCSKSTLIIFMVSCTHSSAG